MKKNFKTAIGMMSGTSLDGIDAALVHIDDDFNFEFIQGHSICYPDEDRKKLLEMANNNATTSDVCNLVLLWEGCSLNVPMSIYAKSRALC